MKLGFKKVYAMKLAEESKILEKSINHCNYLLGFYNDGHINELNFLLKENPINYEYINKKINFLVTNFSFDSDFFRKNVEKLSYMKNIKLENMVSRYNVERITNDLNTQKNDLGNSIGMYIIDQSNSAFLDSDLNKNNMLPNKAILETPFKNEGEDTSKISEIL